MRSSIHAQTRARAVLRQYRLVSDLMGLLAEPKRGELAKLRRERVLVNKRDDPALHGERRP